MKKTLIALIGLYMIKILLIGSFIILKQKSKYQVKEQSILWKQPLTKARIKDTQKDIPKRAKIVGKLKRPAQFITQF